MNSFPNQLRITISTTDDELIKDLLLNEVDQSNNKISISNDCWLVPLQKYQPGSSFLEIPEILGFTINLVSDVSVGILSAWIYNKLRGKQKTEAEIQGRKVNLNDKGSIEKLIITEIRYEKRNN